VHLARQAKHRFLETRALVVLSRIQSGLGESSEALETARDALSMASSAGHTAFVNEAARLVAALSPPATG
jgi:hypothetical protein